MHEISRWKKKSHKAKGKYILSTLDVASDSMQIYIKKHYSLQGFVFDSVFSSSHILHRISCFGDFFPEKSRKIDNTAVYFFSFLNKKKRNILEKSSCGQST